MVPLQTFHDHVHEFRRRMLWVVLAIGISGGASYVLRVQVIRWLQKPLGATLFYTSPAGSFNFILKLSTLIGLFVALPVIIYQLLRFVEPALPVKLRRRTIVKLISASFLLAVAGVAFGYFYLIPESLHFFAGYATAQIKPLISANEYLSYMMGNFITFALIFQIPLLILFINWIKPMRPSKLLHYQRHIVVGSAALSVILPFTYDPISQFIVAIPIVVLYYLSVILLLIVNRKKIYDAKEPAKPTTPRPLFASQQNEIPVEPRTILSTPRPVMATTARKQVSALDGFVVRARTATKPAIQPRPQADITSRTPDNPPLSRPNLSIDGISPSLSA